MVWSPETIKCSLLIISSIGSVQLHMALFVEYCNIKCSNVVLYIFSWINLNSKVLSDWLWEQVQKTYRCGPCCKLWRTKDSIAYRSVGIGRLLRCSASKNSPARNMVHLCLCMLYTMYLNFSCVCYSCWLNFWNVVYFINISR